MGSHPLREELEKMFPTANGEEINMLMTLFAMALEADKELE